MLSFMFICMYVSLSGVYLGTWGVSIQGFGYLRGNDGNVRNFTVHEDNKSVKVFPRAHTCLKPKDL